MVGRESGSVGTKKEDWRTLETVESESKTDTLNPSATDLNSPTKQLYFTFSHLKLILKASIFIQYGFIHTRLSDTFYIIIRQ